MERKEKQTFRKPPSLANPKRPPPSSCSEKLVSHFSRGRKRNFWRRVPKLSSKAKGCLNFEGLFLVRLKKSLDKKKFAKTTVPEMVAQDGAKFHKVTHNLIELNRRRTLFGLP